MTTQYPTDLLEVPADRWSAECSNTGGDDPDYEKNCWSNWTILAADDGEAERRVLSHIHYDYEDELEGWTALSIGPTQEPGMYFVVVYQSPKAWNHWIAYHQGAD